jgi:GAF domain-containing protein
MGAASATTTQLQSLKSRTARLREALSGCGALLAAARRSDPLPMLRDLVGDWLHAETVKIEVPAGTGALQSDDPLLLCGPVTIGRRVIGRIEARRDWPFDEDDRALIAALGQLIGAAFEHATLEGQVDQYASQAQANADTLDRLLAFGREVVSLAAEPIALARQFIAQVPEMVGGDRASVLLIPPDEPEQPVLVLSNGHISTPERASEVLEHGLAGMVLRERAPLIIDETDTDRRWLGLRLSENDTRTRCAMTAPLLSGERALGALTVTTTRSRLFNPAQLDLLELVASNVAIALHAANLEARQARLAARLGAMAGELEVALLAAEAGDGAALAAARTLAAQLRAEAEGLSSR